MTEGISGMTTKGKRVLLVDDDETIVTPFQLILQNEGYQVDTTTTGRQALEMFEKAEYQVVILDIKLPDIHGIEVISSIRKQNDHVSLIVITGYPSLIDSIDAIDIGIDEILLKPIEPDELLRAIKESCTQAFTNGKMGECIKQLKLFKKDLQA